MKHLFTSESVTEGHPDKICDYISDSILDEYLKQDKNSRVGAEVVAGKDTIFITGEISSKGKVDIEKVARDVIKEIGYDSVDKGLDYKTCKIIVNISKQSEDIALGVDKSQEQKEGILKSEGAGDQGMMFGFACDETDNFMPLPIYLAHRLTKQLTKVRKDGTLKYLRPDGKAQVTVEYDGIRPTRVDTIVLSAQHDPDVDLNQLKEDIKEHVIDKVIPRHLLDEDTKYYINPTGRFVVGGPKGDSGLTGRKIIVDTYGGYAHHGGGAFSGKDPTKVDRSASYMARFLAKNIVANHLARECEIELAYAIGVAKPVSIYIETFGTNKVPISEIKNRITKFDLTPKGIIDFLDLRKPIYRKTTNYGHFGKSDLPWERIEKI